VKTKLKKARTWGTWGSSWILLGWNCEEKKEKKKNLKYEIHNTLS